MESRRRKVETETKRQLREDHLRHQRTVQSNTLTLRQQTTAIEETSKETRERLKSMDTELAIHFKLRSLQDSRFEKMIAEIAKNVTLSELQLEKKVEETLLNFRRNQTLLVNQHQNSVNYFLSQWAGSTSFSFRTMISPVISLIDTIRADLPTLVFNMAEEGCAAAMQNDRYQLVSQIVTFNETLKDVKLIMVCVACFVLILFFICLILLLIVIKKTV